MWLNLEMSGNGLYKKGRVRVQGDFGSRPQLKSARSVTYHAKKWAGVGTVHSTTTKRYGCYLISLNRMGMDITAWWEPEAELAVVPWWKGVQA